MPRREEQLAEAARVTRAADLKTWAKRWTADAKTRRAQRAYVARKPKLRILSLDGGPAAATFLRQLRDVLRTDAQGEGGAAYAGFLAQVDVFAGTSNGGMVALWLASQPEAAFDADWGRAKPADFGLGSAPSGVRPVELTLDRAADFSDRINAAFAADASDWGLELVDEAWGYARMLWRFASRSVFRPSRLEALLQAEFGETRLWDLKRRVFVGSVRLYPPFGPKAFTNLATGTEDRARTLVEVALASASLPPVMAIRFGHADGGLAANNTAMQAVTQVLRLSDWLTVAGEPGDPWWDLGVEDLYVLSCGGSYDFGPLFHATRPEDWYRFSPLVLNHAINQDHDRRAPDLAYRKQVSDRAGEGRVRRAVADVRRLLRKVRQEPAGARNRLQAVLDVALEIRETAHEDYDTGTLDWGLIRWMLDFRVPAMLGELFLNAGSLEVAAQCDALLGDRHFRLIAPGTPPHVLSLLTVIRGGPAAARSEAEANVQAWRTEPATSPSAERVDRWGGNPSGRWTERRALLRWLDDVWMPARRGRGAGPSASIAREQDTLAKAHAGP